MLTVDYEFYKNTYHGNKISEAAWPAFSRDAAAYVDKITFGRASADGLDGALKQACPLRPPTRLRPPSPAAGGARLRSPLQGRLFGGTATRKAPL